MKFEDKLNKGKTRKDGQDKSSTVVMDRGMRSSFKVSEKQESSLPEINSNSKSMNINVTKVLEELDGSLSHQDGNQKANIISD